MKTIEVTQTVDSSDGEAVSVKRDVSLRRWLMSKFWLIIWHLTPADWICKGCAYSTYYNKFWHKWGHFCTTQFGTYYE